MFKKFLLSTENLFDKKLKNGTVMVLIIASCVVFTGSVVPSTHASLSANILEAQKNTETHQYIIMNGKKYRIFLEEAK